MRAAGRFRRKQRTKHQKYRIPRMPNMKDPFVLMDGLKDIMAATVQNMVIM